MTWQYGASSVKFSTRANEVLEWTNHGNLRVYVAPGLNTTTGSHFTLGSHKDDVLRVQGTPDSISRYDTPRKDDVAVRSQQRGDLALYGEGPGLVQQWGSRGC